MNLLVLQARESLALPAEWEGYQFSCLPRHQDEQKDYIATHFSIIGVVAPLITRGPRKGRRNWRKMDKSTRREFVVSIADHLTWKLAWEQKNNRCYRCTGTGQTLASVTVADGETYQPCSRCHGEKTARS